MQAVWQVLRAEALSGDPHAVARGRQVQVQLLREGAQVGTGIERSINTPSMTYMGQAFRAFWDIAVYLFVCISASVL